MDETSSFLIPFPLQPDVMRRPQDPGYKSAASLHGISGAGIVWCSVSAGKFLPFKENKDNPEKQRVYFPFLPFTLPLYLNLSSMPEGAGCGLVNS